MSLSLSLLFLLLSLQRDNHHHDPLSGQVTIYLNHLNVSQISLWPARASPHHLCTCIELASRGVSAGELGRNADQPDRMRRCPRCSDFFFNCFFPTYPSPPYPSCYHSLFTTSSTLVLSWSVREPYLLTYIYLFMSQRLCSAGLLFLENSCTRKNIIIQGYQN
ncbi:hypothetical protein F5B22DRAFT_35855 [Xylaria bambusicola]|uniref:uncharacterized protein n=1 Tax=Xylaria bambusicola TaxID=326684 RepID=UPI002007B197|nr:uncharacterized protein F5B22DRAFT_35855 [Xylaria bambusicola]KAI0521052.1 hypothetical protein F5B22DRAFT_35855 [Xylaria bambusicola]